MERLFFFNILMNTLVVLRPLKNVGNDQMKMLLTQVIKAIYQLINLFVPLLIYLSLCNYSRPQHYHPRRQGGTTTTSRGRSPPYSPRPNATATSCVIHAPLPEGGLHRPRRGAGGMDPLCRVHSAGAGGGPAGGGVSWSYSPR